MEGTQQANKRPASPGGLPYTTNHEKGQRVEGASSFPTPGPATPEDGERQPKRARLSPLQLATLAYEAEGSAENGTRDEVMEEVEDGDENESEDDTQDDVDNVPQLPEEPGWVPQIEQRDINWAVSFPEDQGDEYPEELNEEADMQKAGKEERKKKYRAKGSNKKKSTDKRNKKKTNGRIIQDKSPLFWLSRAWKEEHKLSEVPSVIRYTIWRHLLKSKDGIYLDRNKRPERDGRQYLHLAIMSTCRDIYAETLQVLYRENPILVYSEDMFQLEENWANIPLYPGLELPKKSIWRHNPLGGVGRLVKNDLVPEYDSPVLDGYMEPHTFAKFQQVALLMKVSEIDFGEIKFIPGTPTIDSMFIDKPDKMKVQFLHLMGKVDIVRTFSRILGNSPYISRLHMTIQITGLPLNVIDSATAGALKEAADIATQQLGEQFLAFQSFRPLMDLTNIQQFRPSMCFSYGVDSKTKYSPSPSMIETLHQWNDELKNKWMPPRVKKWLRYVLEATELPRRAFPPYTMPFETRHYGLKAKKIGTMVMDERCGKLEYEVRNRSGLGWSPVDFAEVERLGRHGHVSHLPFASSPPPPLTPSSILPPFPCLPLCPCDSCLSISSVQVCSSCPKHCDDCFIPPAPISWLGQLFEENARRRKERREGGKR
ncbi:hypothetical protein ONS96_005430 [Cadophora gregata f. sp. sojae]|nr:hypothetical protein ONS96_008575 [Cadophora gregata f. sp. sojae]KAK0104345.1 hypothetical protein ONS96_005430 [Cadophora gregata f. sp. sojae]